MASSFSHTALRLLLSCAEVIEDGDLKIADKFLHNILILSGEICSLDESRVVKYFADALVRRAYGLHPASPNLTFPVVPAPLYQYDCNRINDVIENVIHDALMEKNALMGNRRLHLIDFSIQYYRFVGSVLCTVPDFSGDPLLVRVSYILPPSLKKHVDVLLEKEFLTKGAQGVNIKLEDELKVAYANSLAEVDDECEIDFKRSREDEMVVVYYKFKLDKLVRDGKAMERELVRLKEIYPAIVIMLDFYSNHAHSNFLTCLEDSLQYSSKKFDRWIELGLDFDEEYEWERHKEGWEGFNLIPSPRLPPLQPFAEGWALNRIAALAEIRDILNHLCCKHEFSLALTWTSKVNNMNEIMSDPNKKDTLLIESDFCYLKDFEAYRFMLLCEDEIEQTINEKALESKESYHVEPSITNLDGEDNPYPVDVKKYDIDVVVAICLQNRYTINDVYVVEFYWPAMGSETSKEV
ncbi:hypothetical protein J1N35_012887 [Gossypium stocksii]|uniref:NLP1-9 GAF domain-containing protein n=1 Tax=Gossypium stocksii TaxID=47602 RepID=A0A9D3VSX9_9ROSI|nr:hypothetical protein J1N35_012887 [Gossypium stocksii]